MGDGLWFLNGHMAKKECARTVLGDGGVGKQAKDQRKTNHLQK